MKKIVILLLVIFLLAACSGNSADDVSQNLEVIEEVAGGIEAEVISFDFEEDTLNADLIVEVTIEEKLEEVKEEPIPYTVFRAEINETFKGDINIKEVTIRQDGDSEWTVNNNKLFESGEKYILFLKEAIESKSDYWILGAETGTFYVLDDNSIQKLAEPVEELKEIEVNYQHETVVLKEKANNSSQIINKHSFIKKINQTKKVK